MRSESFRKGVKDGIPIGLGYFAVSFTFGMMAVADGLSIWQAVLISLTNVTSAGQFAGLTIIAELGTPDMKLPIQYALYYPERRFLPGDRVDFWTLGKLEFEKPDTDTFYGLELAYEAGRKGGSLPTVFNAANELAVSQFLNREIKYLEITEIIEDCMKAHKNIENPTLEQILETEAATYERINSRR